MKPAQYFQFLALFGPTEESALELDKFKEEAGKI